MNKLIISLIIIFPFIVAGISNAGGSDGGYSSSMGDGNKTCTTCHGGSATAKTGWVTSTIPTAGYITGQTYTITVSGTHTGVSRFGFEATTENNAGAKAGTITVTNSGETKLTNSNKAITHTGNGFTPSGDNKSWSFDWTAPAVGTGNITISAALLAGNGDMGTSGDVVYKSELSVTEDITNSIANANNAIISISPNPASDFINVKLKSKNYSNYSIIDITGKQILNDIIGDNDNAIKIDISSIAKGTYFLKLQAIDNNNTLHKFIKR